MDRESMAAKSFPFPVDRGAVAFAAAAEGAEVGLVLEDAFRSMGGRDGITGLLAGAGADDNTGWDACCCCS